MVDFWFDTSASQSLVQILDLEFAYFPLTVLKSIFQAWFSVPIWQDKTTVNCASFFQLDWLLTLTTLFVCVCYSCYCAFLLSSTLQKTAGKILNTCILLEKYSSSATILGTPAQLNNLHCKSCITAITLKKKIFFKGRGFFLMQLLSWKLGRAGRLYLILWPLSVEICSKCALPVMMPGEDKEDCQNLQSFREEN